MALPLILGLLGSTLGTGTAIGALGAGALGSGLGRFLETGDFEEGLKTGATSFLGGKVLGSVLGGMGGKAADAAKNIAGTPTYAEAANIDPTLFSSGVGKVGEASKYFGQSNLMGGLQAAATNPITLGQATIGQSMSRLPEPPKEDEIPFENREAMAPPRLRRRQPPPGFRPGYMGEFDYGVAPNYNVRYMSSGGLNNPEKADLDNDGQLSSYERKRGEAIEKSIAEQGKNMGGLVGLLGNQKVQDALSNVVGISLNPAMQREANKLMTGEFTPEGYSALTMADAGFAEGGQVKDLGMTESEEEIMMNAINALTGKSENPDEDIQTFVQTFGMQALKILQMAIATGKIGDMKQGLPGLIEGEGDGMSDSIDAELVEKRGREGGQKQPLKVANNEYVIAADVVSDIGNGSTDAGADKLDKLMKEVRKARHASGKQPPEKDMMAVMKRAIA